MSLFAVLVNLLTHRRVPSNNKQKEGVERWIDEGVWTKKYK